MIKKYIFVTHVGKKGGTMEFKPDETLLQWIKKKKIGEKKMKDVICSSTSKSSELCVVRIAANCKACNDNTCKFRLVDPD